MKKPEETMNEDVKTPEMTPEVPRKFSMSLSQSSRGESKSDGEMINLSRSPSVIDRISVRLKGKSLDNIQKQAATQFNLNPKKSIEFMSQHGLMSATPQDFATFMFVTPGLSKRKIGEFLGGVADFNQETLTFYLEHIDFSGQSLVDALRTMNLRFRLPGEAQQIDRILEAFATRYTQNNPSIFGSTDVVFILSFSCIMLNTDLHNENIAPSKKMTMQGFLNNNRGIDEGGDINPFILEQLYLEIQENEIRMNESDMYESDVVTFIAPKLAGWLHKKCENFMGSWRKHWFVLTDSCLYYFFEPSVTILSYS